MSEWQVIQVPAERIHSRQACKALHRKGWLREGYAPKRAQAAQRFQLLAACLRSLKLNAMANAVLKDRKQFLVLMQRGAKESAPADDLPPPPRAVQRLTSEPVVKGRDAD